MERRQVPIYLGAILAGAVVGLTAPGAGPWFETVINPVLAALLYVTFLQVPARELVGSLTAGRFFAALLTTNFVVVPVVAAALFWLLPDDRALRIGVLLVLLTPCVDYVIVFSGLAGASSDRLLAATPLLLVAQLLLLPAFLFLFLGADLANIVEFGPFLEAFLVLILIPLTLAWLTQAWAARRASGQTFTAAAGTLVVPLMVATLLVVVASQVPKLGDDLTVVAGVVPFYVGFLAVMAVVGLVVARAFRLSTPDGRAIVFSGATRNSLVVLPLALALPDALATAAAVIVAQTLVEVIGMVVYVRVVPRLLPNASDTRSNFARRSVQ
jgi:ACR3 family arsenite efflux pump ArsB